MNQEQFNTQDQGVIDAGIAAMDASQAQEMMQSVNDRPSVTQTEDGRIVWARGGLNQPRIVHMLEEAKADPRSLNPDRAHKAFRNIAVAVAFKEGNEGLSDAELVKAIERECGVNNLAYTLFPDSENPEQEYNTLFNSAISPVIQSRPVKMKGLAEVALKDYRANAELARLVDNRTHKVRADRKQAALARNEKGEPVDADGNVVEEGSPEQAVDKESDEYLDFVELQKYNEEAVRTELLATMADAASSYKVNNPEATAAELYNAARQAAVAQFPQIVATVDAGGSPYAEFEKRRAAARKKDNVLYFKKMQDAKADLDREGELAREVDAAVDAEKKATQAENRFLSNAANENTKNEMAEKYPNAVPGREKKPERKPFKPATAFSVQVKRAKTAENDNPNPVLVVPQEVFDNLVGDLGVKRGQFARVQIGSGSKAIHADIRAGKVTGYRMNNALFYQIARNSGTKKTPPSYEQLSAIAAGSRNSTLYFYVSGNAENK